MNNKTTKICIFADFPLSAISGESSGRGGGQAATWLPQLARAWESVTDCEIHWGIFDRTAEKIESTRCWNQTFHRVPCPSLSIGLALGRWPHRLGARRLLREIKPDLIHCWGTENLNGSALLEFDGPSILSMQGIITTCFKTGDLHGWRWKLFRHWEPVSLRRANLITSESRWGITKCAGIAPGIHTRQIEYGVHPSYYSIPWQARPDLPRILFVGTLNRIKGIDLLIDMLRRHPTLPWKLVFVGGGYFSETLHNLNHPSIEILGTLKTDQVQEEMSKAWALVMPSRADTSPNVVKEARVIGLPIVGSPNGGHAEYIEHSKDGLIVKTEDPEAWYEALNRLATDYDLCRSMGAARHAHFREYFRPERTAAGFLELYRKMANENL